jgi:hypothetical protein
MKKLHCIICDSCRKVCTDSYIAVSGKKKYLHFCSEECRIKHTAKKIIKELNK